MTENRQYRRMLKRSRVAARLRRAALARTQFLLLAFIAVAIQSLVVQTHIHHADNSGFAAIGVASSPLIASDIEAKRTRDPVRNDADSNCALCQAFTYSGQFVHSAAVLAYVPAWYNVHFIPLTQAIPRVLPVGHYWHGRAPPLI